MSDHAQNTQDGRVESTRRYIRQTPGGGLAFVPYGLVPAVGLILLSLFALFPFASLSIEDKAEQAAMTSLRDAGEGWATVKASGQWLTLSGEAPSPERAANAVTLVRTARAPTPFGKARPVTRIIDRINIAAVKAADPALSDPDAEIPSGTPEAMNAEAERQKIVACEQSIAALLVNSKIEFSVGSARITEQSAPLLDQLGQAVAACNVDITVEGHTDSTGSASLNDGLSLARANAVREAMIVRGIPAARIFAEGYGSSRPVSSNDTPDGRNQNRRIEFKVRTSDTP